MARLGKGDIVSIDDLATADIERIFDLADGFSVSLERGEPLNLASGLIMATLFYEPSTRTRLSFESAMHRMGGAVISSADMHASSAAKGETLADTVRVVGAYADLIVLRHPSDGAARVAADYAPCAVINAGDGSREHPTQTLCDLYILRRKKGSLKGMTVAICGDLKFGRTVHSLIFALARFGANIVAVPYNGMKVPDYVLERIAAERNYGFSSVSMEELRSLAGGIDALYLTPSAPHQIALFTSSSEMPLQSAPPSIAAPAALDAFYLTRMQRERMVDKDGVKDAAPARFGHFDARALKTTRTHDAVVMHPLPRTDELAFELDSDPRAVYFEQAAAGVPVRMALIAWLIEQSRGGMRPKPAAASIRFKSPPRCANANCISRHENAYIMARFRLGRSNDPSMLALICDFCERELRIEFVGHARSHRYYHFEQNLYGYVRQWIEEGSLAVFESVKQAEEGGYEPYRRGPQREIMSAEDVAAACRAMAAQMVADLGDLAAVSLVGVVSHGAILAMRLRDLIEAETRVRPPCAALDVFGGEAALRSLDGAAPFEIGDRTIVLVDDVMNSGWTVQRAMNSLWHRGRPAAVKLAVLIDRGHRAVPIRPNYVGKNIPTARGERVQVRIAAEGSLRGKAADRVVIYSMLDTLKEEVAT